MKFKLVVVGKIKEEYYRAAIAEYVKRLSRFVKTEIIEVDECFFNGTPNAQQINKIMQTEGEAILSKCEGYVFALDIGGKMLDSQQLSEQIFDLTQQYSTFTFVIGGSNGLADVVKQKANQRISFGKITLPHQLCRVVLCEQLYRACCIQNNVPYHK